MAVISDDNMIDIVSELKLNDKKKKRGPKQVIPVLALAVIFLLIVSSIFYKYSNTQMDFSVYMIPSYNPCAIIEAEYVGEHDNCYNYDLMVDGDIISVEANTVLYNIMVTKVWYGNSVAMGKFKIEADKIPLIEEGRKYIFFVYEGTGTFTDFYPIDSPVEQIKKESPYYVIVPDTALIERREDGNYVLPDGSVISEGKLKRYLEKYIKDEVLKI